MPTRAIPKPDWSSFFDDFTRRHRGWLVTVEVMDAELGDQIQADMVPLRALTAEVGHGEDRIYLTVGHGPDSHVKHVFENPERVFLKLRGNGADQVLDVELRDGRTLVLFRSPTREEEVDRVDEEEVPKRGRVPRT